MAHFSEYLQRLTLLAGCVAALIKVWSEWKSARKLQAQEAAAAMADGATGAIAGRSRITRDRDFLELSFVLLFASVASLLFADSLLISGRIVSVGPLILVESMLVAAIVTGLLAYAYSRRKAIAMIGLLSSFSLLVLFTAPGGPFRELPLPGAEGAPDLLLPTLIFLTLSSVTLFYGYGELLSRDTLTRNRKIALTGTAAMIGLCALALGIQFVGDAENRAEVPKLTNRGRALHASLQESVKEPGGRKLVHQLIAERQLMPEYQQAWDELRKSRERMVALREAGNAPAGDAPPRRTTGPEMPSAEYEATRRQLTAAQAVEAEFRRLDPFAQAKLMQARLSQVHPLGELDDRKAPVPILGKTALDRYKEAALHRQVKFIAQQERRAEYIDARGLDYDPRVRLAFGELDALTLVTTPNIKPLPVYSDRLFPTFPAGVDAPLLRKQLILPTREESTLAYVEYRQLARAEMRKRRRASAIGEADDAALEKALDAFDQLPAANRTAFAYYSRPRAETTWKESQLTAMLADVADVDFTPIRGDRYVLQIDRLVTGLTSSDACSLERLPERLEPLCRQLLEKSQVTRDTFVTLASLRNPSISVEGLLDPALTQTIHDVLGQFEPDDVSLAQYIANPVDIGLQALLPRMDLSDTSRPLVTEAWRLEHSEAEPLLLAQAWSLYQSGGPYAPDILTQMILESGLSGRPVKYGVAAAMFLPLLVCCVLLGDFGARKLQARQKLHDMIDVELKAAQEVRRPPQHVDFFGREQTLETLKNLARRGSSTIALAGRRGVGKSRLLRALQDLYGNDDEIGGEKRKSIAVWIVSPARFAEHEFVEDVMERLASSTEAAIGDAVKAKPLIVRELDRRSSNLGTGLVVVSLLGYLLLIDSMWWRLARPELVMSWIPAGLLALGSVGSLAMHFRKLQPVDLTSWIEREREISSQLVWLYGETVKALRFVAERKTSSRASVQLWQEQTNPWIVGTLSVVGTFFFAAVAGVLSQYESETDGELVVMFLLFGLACFLPLATALKNRFKNRRQLTDAGTSLMQLIERYRQYAATVVRRVEAGALETKTGLSPVVICVDELDKIVEFDEMRQFVRRIKSIFEIPGVAYYLSISEDALAALYLGTSVGKNEVDSAFDHIVTVPPLDLETAERVAVTFVRRLDKQRMQPRVARLIAAISFGIPRDILRRCDELRDPVGQLSASDVAESWLSAQLDIGLTSGLLSDEMSHALRTDKARRLAMIQEACDRLGEATANREKGAKRVKPSKPSKEEATLRYLLLLGTLALLQEATSLDDAAWLARSAALSQFGYRLPTRSWQELLADFRRMEESLRTVPPFEAVEKAG